MKRLNRSSVLLLVAFALCAVGASAQTYPNRPIKLIVADSAGGAPDQLGRLVAQKLSSSLGQQVVIDNRAGAGGALGAELVAKSAPDGYTLLLTTTAIYAILPNLRKNLPYDPVKDFVPISRIATASNVLVVNNELPREQHRRTRQAREGEARLAQLRVGRRGHAGAPGRRDAEPAGRHHGRARSVQGRGPGANGRHRRQRAITSSLPPSPRART